MGFLRAMHAPCFKPHFMNTFVVYENDMPVAISYGDRCVQYAGIDYYVVADITLLHHVIACFDNPMYTRWVVDALVRIAERGENHPLSIAGRALRAATETARKATNAMCSCGKPLPVIAARDDVIAKIALGMEAEPQELDVAIYVCESFMTFESFERSCRESEHYRECLARFSTPDAIIEYIRRVETDPAEWFNYLVMLYFTHDDPGYLLELGELDEARDLLCTYGPPGCICGRLAAPQVCEIYAYVRGVRLSGCEAFNAVKHLLPEHEYHELAEKCGM